MKFQPLILRGDFVFPTQQDVSSSTIHRDTCSFWTMELGFCHAADFTVVEGHHPISKETETSNSIHCSKQRLKRHLLAGFPKPSNQTKWPGTRFFSGKTTKAATDHSADTKAAVQSLKKHWPDRPSRYHLKPLAVRQWGLLKNGLAAKATQNESEEKVWGVRNSIFVWPNNKQAGPKKKKLYVNYRDFSPTWMIHPQNSSGWPWSWVSSVKPWRGSAKTELYLLTNLDRFSTSHHGWATKHLPKCFEWDFMIELSWRERKTNFRMNIYKKAISNQQPFQVAKT